MPSASARCALIYLEVRRLQDRHADAAALEQQLHQERAAALAAAQHAQPAVAGQLARRAAAAQAAVVELAALLRCARCSKSPISTVPAWLVAW
jgi:hypothetical protein